LREGLNMIVLDGSQGEGGGQILRSALALSLCTGAPFRIDNIRAGRPRPGLMRQHLTAVQAATQVGNAETTGAAVGSRSLTFRPGKLRAGDYTFSVGTAGSATLVLQTVLPALVTADGPSRLVIEGGTHNPASPPFDFLDRTFLPLLARMGPRVCAKLERPGFYPAGGGRISVSIEPAPLIPLVLERRGEIRACRARAIVANLPRLIAERELACLAKRLDWVDTVALARGHHEGGDSPLEPYVNDRSYVASSFLSVALSRVFGTALHGRCEKRPELANRALSLVARLSVLPCRGGESLLRQWRIRCPKSPAPSPLCTTCSCGFG
jgi:RNA 3'-terminal phosphate cyclase